MNIRLPAQQTKPDNNIIHRTQNNQLPMDLEFDNNYVRIMQTFFTGISSILLTNSSKLLGRPLIVIPSPMFQCNVDIHDVYPLHCV